MIERLLAEPPFRMLPKALLRWTRWTRARARWDACDRPQYHHGVLYAAYQALREGGDAISVIEFGVAEGYGLLVLESHAVAVERETGVRVNVYGFDSGGGMPAGAGDHRTSGHRDRSMARSWWASVPRGVVAPVDVSGP